VSSPSAGASSAFGLGSGAFASFGSSTKTPKTPGGFDLNAPKTSIDKKDGQGDDDGSGSHTLKSEASASYLNQNPTTGPKEHPIKSTWIVWYRPPTPKYSDYEKSTVALASISSVESFWAVYSHLKRPSLLPTVSDYHIFKKGIRPVWEDEANKKGGKWIIRLKKGVADRYWEDLLLAIVGDQFAEASDEVCGAVLSVRSGEDVLSVWTKIDGGRNIKIRCVSFPSHCVSSAIH
jgi:translation initiation factor 4E